MTRLTLPDNVSVGLYKQINERWSVMADLQWTDWSLVDTITRHARQRFAGCRAARELAQYVVWRSRCKLSTDR